MITSDITIIDNSHILPHKEAEEDGDEKKPIRTMIASDDAIIPTETFKARKENDRLARESSDKTSGFSLFALLFTFFLDTNKLDTDANVDTDNLSVNQENPENDDKIDDKIELLSDIFGLDKEQLIITVNKVNSGEITAFSAATETIERITPEKIDWDKAHSTDISSIIGRNTNQGILHPDLVDRMNKDPKVAQMVQWTFEAAEREGIDGNLLANQYWEESDYNPNAGSGKGAKGIAQFLPSHKGSWGLETDADFFDPKKSIDAGAKFMAHLTNKMGNQHLAMIAYNGGKGALDLAKDNTSPSKELTVGAWMEFMENRQKDYRTIPELIARDKDGAWHNETLNYIKRIDPTYWDKDLLARAENQSNMNMAFNDGGVDQRTDPILTPEFNNGQGVDQIELAAAIGQKLADAKTSTLQTSPS